MLAIHGNAIPHAHVLQVVQDSTSVVNCMLWVFALDGGKRPTTTEAKRDKTKIGRETERERENTG
jgi:hypothetical protein